MKHFQNLLISGLLILASGAYAFDSSIPDAPEESAQQAPASAGIVPLIEQADEPLPEVLTASRLRQPKSRTPGTVTILEGDLLRSLGILNLWEAFRLVPGMTVGYVGSNNPVVTYHGTVAVEQRRLQVLVDGRSYYNASLADVDWNNIPVAMPQVERIEITRSPNAAAYGSNSFLAVINIITRAAEDTQGAELAWSEGVRGKSGHRTVHGAAGERFGNTNLRVNATRRESDGFDSRTESDDSGEPQRISRNDGYELQTLGVSSATDLSAQDVLKVRAGYHDVYQERDREEEGSISVGELGLDIPFAATDPDTTGEDWYSQVSWQHEASPSHSFEFMAYYQSRDRRKSWDICFDDDETIVIDEAFEGELPATCGEINEDLSESRAHFEFQENRDLSDYTRLMYGLSYREERYESDTFFNGKGNNHLTQVFANVEREMTDWLTLNAGGMWEKDRNNGTFFSPRGALNVHLSPSQTLRFVFSRAHRLPDPFERSADWAYRPDNVRPDEAAEVVEGVRLEGDGISCCSQQNEFLNPLEEETITSREISYLTQVRRGQGLLSAEVKIFRDSLTNLISGVTNIDEWNLENSVDVTQKGIELEATADFPRNYFRLTYAHLDADAEYTGDLALREDVPEAMQRSPSRFVDFETRMNARNSGSVAWVLRLPQHLTGSVAYYLADSLRGNQQRYRYERADFRLGKAFHFPNSSLELATVYQYYVNDNRIYRSTNNRKNRNHLFAEVNLRF